MISTSREDVSLTEQSARLTPFSRQRLEALEPTEDNVGHVNAIRSLALACQLPLQGFLTRLQTYESSLGPWTTRSSIRNAGTKMKWAISFEQEVEKLRALVAAKLININVLLAAQTSEAVSSLHVRAKNHQVEIISKIMDQRAALDSIDERLKGAKERLEYGEARSQARLDAVLAQSYHTHTTIVNIRSLAEQVMAFVGTFTNEVRGLLHSIVQADWRTYQAVLQLHERLARSPSFSGGSYLRFTNALGEYRELPYEFFCHWEPFEGFPFAQFKGKPGENKVLQGHFHIIDPTNHKAIIEEEHWSRSISQGKTLEMSMIMSHLQVVAGRCPRSDCVGADCKITNKAGQAICSACHLSFFTASTGLENALSYTLISDDEVARQQADEDMRLYGSRPEPPDVIHVHDPTGLAKPPSKRTASDFQGAIDRPVKIRKKSDDHAFSHETVTALDWNGGLIKAPSLQLSHLSCLLQASPSKNRLFKKWRILKCFVTCIWRWHRIPTTIPLVSHP